MTEPAFKIRDFSDNELTIRKEQISNIEFENKIESSSKVLPSQFEMRNTDIYRGKLVTPSITIEATYGKLNFKIADIARIDFEGDGNIVGKVTLNDNKGVHMGTLQTDDIRIRTSFGQVLSVYKDKLRAINLDAAASPGSMGKPAQVSFATSGKDTLTGAFVRIPGGRFRMGSTNGRDDERPVHRFAVKSFRMGKYEVTVGQFRKFVEATDYVTEAEQGGGCYVWNGRNWNTSSSANWESPGFSQSEKSLVVCVSWNDAQRMIGWLNGRGTGHFRLPSEAEWEYAARAGSTGKYSWGESIGNNLANCNGCGSRWDNEMTAPVGSFAPNQFGLYDMHGNVWEWVQDVYHDSYRGAPRDGSAWEGSGSNRVLCGGSWLDRPGNLRSANRNRNNTDNRNNNNGFRLVQSAHRGCCQQQLPGVVLFKDNASVAWVSMSRFPALVRMLGQIVGSGMTGGWVSSASESPVLSNQRQLSRNPDNLNLKIFL